MSSKRKKFTYKYGFDQNPHPGMFIAFEGLDGSGNSTQASRVAKAMEEEGLTVHLTKEPTNGPVGAMIRLALENRLKVDFQTLQMMFTVDRADHLDGDRGIVSRLKDGQVVISDRYLFSTLAFGYSSNLDVEWLMALQSRFILPDVTYFLEVDPAVCIERVRKRGKGMDIFEKQDQLEKVRDGYTKVREWFGDKVVAIDGEKEIEVISEMILKKVGKQDKYKKLLNKTQQTLIE